MIKRQRFSKWRTVESDEEPETATKLPKDLIDNSMSIDSKKSYSLSESSGQPHQSKSPIKVKVENSSYGKKKINAVSQTAMERKA